MKTTSQKRREPKVTDFQAFSIIAWVAVYFGGWMLMGSMLDEIQGAFHPDV